MEIAISYYFLFVRCRKFDAYLYHRHHHLATLVSTIYLCNPYPELGYFIDVMIVEHSQQTDLREFYANTDLSNFETLKNQLKEWQFSYNYQRLHGFLKGKTPAQYSRELGDKTPL
ncbi:MAG: integrase core domain-containing protein [Candidatus Megaira endosymbiont of Carteria cerasiformis]|nr:integrase core domain-containing protein [Candidatus Megaera polyxenophila]MCC8460427.1 integrase core domain-containing protein [Candidatus Megaera polyxenophila]